MKEYIKPKKLHYRYMKARSTKVADHKVFLHIKGKHFIFYSKLKEISTQRKKRTFEKEMLGPFAYIFLYVKNVSNV